MAPSDQVVSDDKTGQDTAPTQPQSSWIGTRFLGIVYGSAGIVKSVANAASRQIYGATITWEPPDDVEWVPGGFKLTKAQLNATVEPKGIALTYTPDVGEALPPGDHTLKVESAATDTLGVTAKSVTITVSKAKTGLAWKALPSGSYVPGGFVLGTAQLGAIENPANLKLVYEPAEGTKLDAGTHELSVRAADAETYDDTPVTTQFVVDRGKATITWDKPPAAVSYVHPGCKPDSSQLTATIAPVEAGVAYEQADQAFKVGEHTLRAVVKDAKNFDATPVESKFTVNKANATIQWKAPAAATYAPGGYKPGDSELTASVDPVEAGIAYDLPKGGPKGGLGVGEHTLTATVKDTDNYDAKPVAVTLKVDKAKATIRWGALDPVNYAAGGYKVGEKELTATVEPAEAGIEYELPNGGVLGAGTHTLKAAVKDTTNFDAKPATTTLKVNAAKAAITWNTPKPVEYAPGGFALTKDQLNAALALEGSGDTLGDGALLYTPELGTKLDVGQHGLTARPADAKSYDAAPAKVTLTVNKATAEITWAELDAVDWAEGGYELDHAELNASVKPPGVKLKYDPDIGARLTPGVKTLKVAVADPNYTGRGVSIKLDVVQTPEQKRAEKVRQQSEKEAKPKKAEKLTPEQIRLAEQKRQENRRKATELAEEEVAGAVLKNEYPFGAANSIPHIHSYGSGFHLKIVSRNSVKRYNLVKDGERTPTVDETLALAWQYDEANGTNIKKILTTMLKDYE